MPKLVDHDARRAELADATLAIIAEGGITAVTTRAVAERSGWSTGVINHYFNSRHDLLVGSLQRAAEVQGRTLRRLRLASTLDPMERLTSLIESILPLDDRRVAMTRIFLVFYAEAGADPAARVEIADYLHNWRRVVERITAAAQDRGEIDSNLDPAKLAIELVGLADGLAIHAILDDDVLAPLKASGLRLELLDGRWRLGPNVDETTNDDGQ